MMFVYSSLLYNLPILLARAVRALYQLSYSYTILIGQVGFEPTTTRPPTVYAT